MTPERTPEGKWVLYHGTTGQRIERWPVDARGMLVSGDYLAAPAPAVAEEVAPAADAESVVLATPRRRR